ncbi:hypothetical protein [Rhodococcus spongiicola]|uniref:Phospholipase n=1 Tax=Rhodococcus spongiicola TaxID=2487352 RepID=A0A3S3E2Z1_9NOCA|nr:hypothetical protein [Rhodococcus spongiicola]RVW04707.1 hypothetical protein EF834_06705 [Rhodococcus spongiicola]
MRTNSWAAAILTGAAIATVLLAVPPADADTPLRESSTAARAVQHLTSPASASDSTAVPADFTALLGYQPKEVDGVMVNPHGACSSPVPLPAEFDTACKAHDLGYDLLRYAHLTGGELGPWARNALDAQLDRRMHAACDTRERDRASCFALANIATTAVSVNSRRQGYGVPIDEPWIRYGLAGALGVLGLLATAITVQRIRRLVTA